MNKRYIKTVDKLDSDKYIQEQDDFIIAKGGDGTLLKAIKMHKDKNKPFFGVAAGSVNFLMNSSDVITKKAKYKKFYLIKVKVFYIESGVKKTKIIQGFNDISIGGADSMTAWISFDVKEKDDFMGKFKGGGLIFSTAQGSTGVNKNNYGVVLPLSSKYWSITGDKTNKNINSVLKPHYIKIKVKSRNDILLWVDGSNYIVSGVYKIEVSKGDKVTVIFNKYSEFKKKRRV